MSTFKSPSNLLSRSMRQRTRSFTAWFTALVLIVQSLAASALTRPLADARPGVVEGQVWVDMDNDGIYGPDEDALGGVRLSLRDGDVTIEEAVSSGSGVYRFIAVPAGEYQVVADLPEGYDVTLVPDESEDGALINEFSIDEDGRAAAAEIRVEDATTSEVGLGLVATAEDSAEPTTPTVPETTTTTAPPETTTTTLPSDVTVPPDTTTTTVAEEQLEAEELAPSAAVADEKVVGPMRFAEDGVGLYTGSIDWFEWGDAHGELIPEEGVTRTNTRNVAGGVLSTTCTLGPPTGGDLFVYRSGSFSGDAFDDMYNIGGVGANNELLAGLASSNGSTIQFSFDCSVTFNGDPVPLAGLVMADAEQSNSGQNEYVQATIGPEGTWRIIDRYRTPGCTSSTPATLTADNTLRLGGANPLCAAGPAAVAFMEGVSSAQVEINGGGVSAIALGVMLFTDFGDAPSSYGDAGALYSPPFTGGTLPVGTTPVSGPDFTLATPGQPAPRLGATVDSEEATQADDGDDEDALAAPPLIFATPGADYTLTDIACTGPGVVAGWIDWDGNGTFDADERSDEVECTGSSVDLTWTVPADADGSAFRYLRLRIGPDSGSVSSPTGITTAGEVEDYPIVSTELASWDCTADGFLFQYPGNVSPTQIQRIDMVTGEATPHLELADVRVNAVGFNVLDGYIYGWNFDAPTGPVRIGADGTVLPLPLNGSVPQSTYLSGDVDENGHYWVTNQASGSWAQIDLATMEVIATGDVTGLDGFSAGPDWAYVPGGGDHLYRVMQHDASGNAHLIAFNRTTKQFEDRGSLGVVDTSHTFGAVYADSDGFLYLSSNNTGRIFRVDVHDVTATLFSEGPSSGFNDGTRCFDAPVPVDFGDAPDGYRTSLEFDGARHGMPGYDEASSTALVMLGALIDAEEDGQPSTGADGDDVDGVDDEDGVAFNPDLGYATDVLRTGLDPVSLQPIENTLVVEASAEGFVSVWVDWNQDGDFDDAGEQVANAESVDAGENAVSFAQGTNPDGIETYVRVRYSTDPDAISTPGGPAPDGEVEDYRVLVERLVQPDACVDTGQPYYAFTFEAPVDPTGEGEPGSTARYENVSVVDGVPIDMFVETLSGSMNNTTAPPNGFRVGDGGVIGTDDAQWQINSEAAIRYSFYEAGTDTEVPVNAVFTVNDMDGLPGALEVATFSLADLAGYAVTQGSAVEIVETGDEVEFHGNGGWNGDPQSRFQVVLESISSLDVHWQGSSNSGFGFDGDGDLTIQPPACEDFGDAPESYGTLLADDGPRHTIVPGLTLGAEIDFDPDGQPTTGADGDDTNRLDDEDGVDINPSVPGDVMVVQPGTNSAVVEVTGVGFLSAWVDLNQNGSFDADERIFDDEPVTDGTNVLDFDVPVTAPHGQTYARFRLASMPDTADSPTGAAPDGEVEDYPVHVAAPVGGACDAGLMNAGFEEPFVPGPTPFLAQFRGGDIKIYHESVVPGWSFNASDPDDDTFTEEQENAIEIWRTTPAAFEGAQHAEINAYVFGNLYQDMVTTPGSTLTWRFAHRGRSGEDTIALNIGAPGATVQQTVETTGNTAWQVYSGTYVVPAGQFITRFEFEAIDSATGDSTNGNFLDAISFGVLCPSDFGDAPDSYGTTLNSDGAYHEILGHDVDTNSADLMLGSAIDDELDGAPTAGANGDDLNGLDDEDGVAEPIVLTAGLATSVTVTATNNTDQPATLAGWIDLDGNGTFDPDELETITVPANSGAAEYELSFGVPQASGNTYARFRLFPGDVSDPLPTGAATGGEVEDYPVAFVPGPPIFLGCSDLRMFDDSNENWRAATTRDGSTVVLPPQPVGWAPDVGNPGGALIEEDLDGNWTELWTPELVANGYATDYSGAIGDTLQFDYKNDTGIDVDLYVAIQSSDGRRVFYNFRDQIVDSTQWTRVRVPMVAAEWQTGFDNDTGPVGPAPSAAEFEEILSDVDHFAFSIEGRTGPDTTLFDNFGSSCDDLGDAPESYGTFLADEGAVHRTVGLDTDTGIAPLMLGAVVDSELDGAPSTGADGDDVDGLDDEDGVADPISLLAGQETTVDVLVTNNTGQPATLVGWIDLDGNGTFDPGERSQTLVEVDPLTTEVHTLTFDPGTTTSDTYARFRLYPGIETDPQPTGAASGGEVEDYPVSAARVHYEKSVTPDDVAALQPGDTFTFTVTVSNLGSVPLADLSFTDDLSGVIGDGDASYNGDVSVVSGPGTATFTPDVISWDLDGDTLAPGGTAVVEYSVTIADPPAGDGVLFNGVLGTGPGSNCADDPATDIDCYVEIPQPRIAVDKGTEVGGPFLPGETVLYEFSVINLGPGDANNVVVWDDLSEVLDDAVYNNDAEIQAGGPGTVSYDAVNQRLVWNGPLASGQVVFIRYSITVNDADSLGDGAVRNALLNSACPNPPIFDTSHPDFDDNCVTVNDVAAWTVRKTSDAVGRVEAGDTVVYTVEIENTGNVALSAADVVVTDDLTGVLDDATYNDDADDDGHSGEFSFSDPILEWSGSLAVDEVVTLTYSVTINEPDALGDGQLVNAVTGGNCPDPAVTDPTDPDFDPDCVVTDDIAAWTVTKTSSAPNDPVLPGDVVAYEITVENVGNVDLSAAEVLIEDDLSGILDDAEYNNDVDQGAVYTEPVISWSGDLAVDEVVTITYSVTVKDATALGDGRLRNAVTGGDCPDPAVTDPTDPDFDPDCVVIDDIAAWTTFKSSNADDPVLPGDEVEYTITVINTGNVALTDPSDLPTFEDDLSEVLDDAEFTGASATSGTVSYSEPVLTWEGELLVGQEVTVTYSVTVNDAEDLGDGRLRNAVTGSPNCPDPAITDPADPDFDADCVVIDDISAWTVTKTSNASDPVLPGDVVEYTLTVENLGNVPLTAAEVSIEDDLSGVLDDATLDEASISASSGTASFSDPVLTWTGDLDVDQVVTITYSVEVLPADSLGDGQLLNAVTGSPNCPDPAVTDPTDPDFDPDCVTISDIEAWTVVKTSDAADPVQPGDAITYTLTVENTGNVALSDVEVSDDLSGVLDDATLDEASISASSGTASFSDPVLTWSGDLSVDQVVTITYSVEVLPADSLGDGVLRNAVTGGDCPDPAITDPTDPDFDPDCVTIDPISAYTVTKRSDAADPVLPGDTITYTVAVENTGGTALTGATFSDDLSGVLDDATLDEASITASSGTASFADPVLTWTGDLAVDEVATISYSVTVDQPIGGDHQLVNAVVGGDCPDPAITDPTDPDFDDDCVLVTLLPGVHITKVVFGDPVDDLQPGDSFEYVVTVENIGQVNLVGETFTDDLTEVLDDATLDDASMTATTGTVTFADPELTWTGDLLVGQIATIRYTIDIDDPVTGDGELFNAVVGSVYSNCAPPDVEDPDCWEETPIPNVHVAKEVVGPTAPQPGDVVTYRITIENRGGAIATDEVVTDDLTGVLDDAVYNGDAAADSGTLDFDHPILTWTGDVPAGETVVITYSVKVNAAGEMGDRTLDNVVTGGENCPDDDVCATTSLLPDYEAEKSVVGSSDAGLGETVTYQITVTNTGLAPLAEGQVTDDLTDVIDDATYNDDAVATGGTVSYSEPILTWTGGLAVDETVTITYSVTVAESGVLGDGDLVNVISAPNCPVLSTQDHHDGMPEGCATETPIPAVEYRKTIVSPTAAEVRPGEVVRYRIEVFNRGRTDLTGVSFTDDLSDVLENASYLHDAVATTGNLSYDEPVLSWTGDLPEGGSATVEYSVRVHRDVRGDVSLDNRVVGDGPYTNCPAGSPSPECVSNIVIDVDNPLPHTGVYVLRIAAVAAVLFLLGWALVVASRRRRTV